MNLHTYSVLFLVMYIAHFKNQINNNQTKLAILLQYKDPITKPSKWQYCV